MKVTVLGHAGLHIETQSGTILCDPWVNPAFFASWFPFPDNTCLDWEHYGQVDLLYLSHLHKDHFDPKNLTENVSRDATVLLPDYPTDDMRRELTTLGFRNFRRLPNAQRVEHDGVVLMISALTAPNDGAVGDSALAVDDGSAAIFNQNDAKLTDFGPVREFAPFDAHFLQFSGANWWPWVYTFSDKAKRAFGATKRANGLERALRFAEGIAARHVVPFAGPACFLDDELFALNDLDNDASNTFPDQLVFLDYLRERGVSGGLLAVPGTILELTRDDCKIVHPEAECEVLRPFVDKPRYLRSYAESKQVEITTERDSWRTVPDVDVYSELQTWFEPLMQTADHICTGIGSLVLLQVDDERVLIDFLNRRVRRYAGEKCRYSFAVARPIMQKLISEREVDWVNSLFLSMRFQASRIGPYNEYLYAFFTCLSPERMGYAESYYTNQHSSEDDVRVGDWWVERRCPHRNADLARFGELDGDTLTCGMHGWKFDLRTGRCLTSAGHEIRSYPDPDRTRREVG